MQKATEENMKRNVRRIGTHLRGIRERRRQAAAGKEAIMGTSEKQAEAKQRGDEDGEAEDKENAIFCASIIDMMRYKDSFRCYLEPQTVVHMHEAKKNTAGARRHTV
ncbi:MAG: hypothetical protein MMC23_006469 [Stictis urceolatum]|nr:hypothetical protein [Stictis urceolata]